MGESEKNNRLTELLNMERLQAFQDNLSKALGLAFVTVDYRGRPVTENSGFTAFCSCMQKHGKYGHLCSQCYAHGGLQATMAGKPHIYRCHCGLVEFAVPVTADGKYIGAVMGGQCEIEGYTPALEPVLAQRSHWVEDPELARTRGGVHKTTYEKLEAGIRLVEELLSRLLEEDRCRLAQEELRDKKRELVEEKAARANLELAVREEDDSGALVERLDSEHLFFVLNVISRLAFLEKAEETERTACDFAAMMRYVLENGDYSCVTLGEELEYIDYYLQIQRRRMEGRLRCEINVPELYHSALCPFMLLHPLVKRMVRQVMEHSREGGSLVIDGREEKDILLVTIRADCAGRKNGQMPEPDEKRQEKSLSKFDQSLKSIFGPRYGIVMQSRGDGMPGTEIQIRLPLHGTDMD